MYFQACSNSAYPQHSDERYRTNDPLVSGGKWGEEDMWLTKNFALNKLIKMLILGENDCLVCINGGAGLIGQ